MSKKVLYKEVKSNDITWNGFAEGPYQWNRGVNYAIVPEDEVSLNSSFFLQAVQVRATISFNEPSPLYPDDDVISNLCRVMFFTYKERFHTGLPNILNFDTNLTADPTTIIFSHYKMEPMPQYNILYDKFISPPKDSEGSQNASYTFSKTFYIKEWVISKVNNNSTSFGFHVLTQQRKSKNIKYNGIIRTRYRTKE